MRSSPLPSLGALLACLLSSSVLAYSTGITGYSGRTGATCMTCHGVGATPPSVELSGPTSLAAGATGEYVFTLRGGPAAVGGVDIAVSSTAATLTPAAGSGMEQRDGELTHSPSPRPFVGDVLRFAFTLKAPSTGGAITLYAAGNSADGNSGNPGDGIATTKLEVTVTGGTTTPEPVTPAVPEAEARGCATAGGAPGMMALLLASLLLTRRVRA